MEQSVPNFHTEPASKSKKARPLSRRPGRFLWLTIQSLAPRARLQFFFDAFSLRKPAIHPRIKFEGMPENAACQPRVRERIMKLS